MRFSSIKSRIFNSVFFQILIIITAFLVMGVSSFIFVSNIERKHLTKDAENMLALTKNIINAKFLEYEAFLDGYSQTIRNMILWGTDEETVTRSIKSISSYILNDTENLEDLHSFFGYFFNWDQKYISNFDLNIPDDYIFLDQPWIKAAIEANGKIVISEHRSDIFESANSGKKTNLFTLSRYLTYENNEPMAVFSLNIEFDRIINSVISCNMTNSSYGLLLNKNLELIAHPEPFLLQIKLHHINSGLSSLAPELEKGIEIKERRLKNYQYNDSIVYFQRIRHDWSLGIVIPEHEYYSNVTNMAVFLVLIGLVMASALCLMIYNLSRAKLKSDLRTQQKSNFLATMSHEIRTPLNAILGMTEIQMQNASHPPATSEAFIKINNSGNLLLAIINDILDLSKIETGKLSLIPAKYEVASLINDIIQLNYIRYESNPVEFIAEIDENIPSVLVGDELRIKQIMNHLLSNAFKYTDQGRVCISVRAECIGRGGAVHVTLVFQIRDTGQGMTPGQVNKLFDDYTRFNMEANRTSEGAGLGMTITRNLIELMYGKINIQSEVGKGTAVTVRIPQKTDGVGIRGILGKEMAENLRQYKQGNMIQLKKSQVAHEYMPYGNILIVDDVETNLYVAKGLMTPYGLNIDLAVNGFEAIDKVRKGTIYDIIFMDHMMPKMDGIETTKLIREIGYTNPIVALTANALAGQEEIFLKKGFNGFISKPIDIRQLNVMLNRLIRDKYPSEVIEAARKEKEEFNKKNTGGSANLQVDSLLAEIFSRDADKTVVVLENVLLNNLKTESDIQSYVINIHAMKSALANIGEKKLSESASRLEQAGREKDVNVMLSETHVFIDDLRKVIEKIKPVDDENKYEENEEDRKYLRENFEIIKEACTDLNKKLIKDTLSKLREKQWSSKTKDVLNTISEHLLHSDFDNAAALADEYINMKTK
ncbi:MAG: ATP-binding protein [Treponema sp.]|nr:ATP-binding protein [Treponema sp.]MCL2272372.1 ATP-binding protein [Treponema sp.]